MIRSLLFIIEDFRPQWDNPEYLRIFKLLIRYKMKDFHFFRGFLEPKKI